MPPRRQLPEQAQRPDAGGGLLPRAMVILAGLWARCACGMVVLPGPPGARPAQIRLHEGGLVERSDYMRVNAAIRHQELNFVEGPSSGPSDWAGLGKMLFERAAAQLEQRGYPDAPSLRQGLTLHAPFPRLDGLPLTAGTRTLLAQAHNGAPVSQPLDPMSERELSALLALGLASLGRGDTLSTSASSAPSAERRPPNTRPSPGPTIESARGADTWDADEILFLGTHTPTAEEEAQLAEFFASGPHALVQDEHTAEQELLLNQARGLVSRGQWQQAYNLLVQAAQLRLDHPTVLAYMAWTRMKIPLGTCEERMQAGQRWIAMAMELDPQDQEVRSIHRLTRVMATECERLRALPEDQRSCCVPNKKS